MNQQQELVKAGKGKDYDYSQDHCYVKASSVTNNGELNFFTFL